MSSTSYSLLESFSGFVCEKRGLVKVKVGIELSMFYSTSVPKRKLNFNSFSYTGQRRDADLLAASSSGIRRLDCYLL
jgi:hypothetical protein